MTARADVRGMSAERRPVVAVLERSNAYQAAIVEGLRAALAADGVPLLMVYRDPNVEAAAPSVLRALAALRPVGVVMMSMASAAAQHDLLRVLEDGDAAVVVLGSATAGWSVRADNAGAMRDVVRHLVEEGGARRPVLVRGVVHQVDSADRERAVRDELARLGVPLDDALCLDGEFERARTYAVMGDLLRRRRDFDAVVALDDRSALGAVDALVEAGLRVPEDVLVTGFNDEDVATLSVPSLTSVSQELAEQGAVAARLARTPPRPGEEHVVRVATRLVRRRSTDPSPAGGDGDAGLVEDARRVSAGLSAEMTVLDTYLAMNRALSSCRDVDEVVAVLAADLPRLRMRRHLLVLFDRTVPWEQAGAAPVLGRVVLRHGGGAGGPGPAVPGPLFDVERLLPDGLRHELDGTLALQPLSTRRGEFGYLLLDQAGPDRFVGDAVRLDVSRTVALLSHNAELSEQALGLQALVARRTAELEAEVATRRRAEHELRALNDGLRSQVRTDGLTGIGNRAALDAALGSHWRRHAGSGAPLSLLMIDVDRFKAYNDTYGHQAGDACLQEVARCLRGALYRSDDLPARYGGEEFAVVLPGTGAVDAAVVAERIRAHLAAAAVPHSESATGFVTVSIGVATVLADSDAGPSSLVALADSALYAAKAAGRDRVSVAAGPARVDARPR